MSYIDMFDHEHVGFFAGLPIYRPLEENVPNSPEQGEFYCNEKNLVLGGGWLEHPALVIRDLDYVAAQYIRYWLDFCEDNKCSLYDDKTTDGWAKTTLDYLFDKDKFKILDFVHWSLRDHSEFYESCKSNALRNPFVETQRRNEFETWLASNFGELVVFSYPELITNEKLQFISKKVNRYYYGNITILPWGYPTDNMGRITKDGQSAPGVRAWKVSKNV